MPQEHTLTQHHSSLVLGVGREGGGGGGGHVTIEQGLSAVYTCLHTGMVSPLQGYLLPLVSSHLITLVSKLLLQLEELFVGSMQVSAPLGKLLLQLV